MKTAVFAFYQGGGAAYYTFRELHAQFWPLLYLWPVETPIEKQTAMTAAINHDSHSRDELPMMIDL